MKKFLPIFIFSFLIFLSLSFLKNSNTFAQTTPSVLAAETTDTSGSSGWHEDGDVTFAGKIAARSKMFLNWMLKDPYWSSLGPNGNNSLVAFWAIIRNIIYAFFVLLVLIAAFIIIISRGKNLTLSRFIPRFLAVILLVTFSFALVQFLYQITDVFQVFFLKNQDGTMVSSKDLLNIEFDYVNFQGFRISGPDFDESAFISLLLVKLTAITYYAMTGILLVRKIILWFFIIISPVFPVLILFAPIRNTAKIWVGEFFRWLLYAPLFAVFLSGLVALWRTQIPLNFNNFVDANIADKIVYPTAINILLGGPGQAVSITNSVNTIDTFALYVVALIMLWVVILLPFLLLKIFLDYFQNFSFANSDVVKQMVKYSSSFINKTTPPPPSFPPTPPPPPYKGMARAIPLGTKVMETFSAKKAETVSKAWNASQISTARSDTTQVLQLANLSIPTMADIARYEIASISKDISKHEDIAKVHETLERIANPNIIGIQTEKERFNTIREKLVTEKEKGNNVAAAVLNAATNVSVQKGTVPREVKTQSLNQVLVNITNPQTVTNEIEKQSYVSLKEKVVQEAQKGNSLANYIVSNSEIYTAISSTKSASNASISNISASTSTAAITTNSTSTVSVSSAEKTAGQGETEQLKTTEKTKEQEKITEQFKEKLKEEEAKGNPLAAEINGMIKKEETKKAVKAGISELPQVNKVQSVSFDDYESVKKMWQESYQKVDPPKNIAGKEVSRKEWVKNDIEKINDTINLLLSPDQQKQAKGKEMVSKILPFLLIGGFSQTEVIAYLKAKMEAGKTVLSDIEQKENEEETMVEASQRKEEKPKEMEMRAEANPNQTVETLPNLNNPLSQLNKTDEKDQQDSNA